MLPPRRRLLLTLTLSLAAIAQLPKSLAASAQTLPIQAGTLVFYSDNNCRTINGVLQAPQVGQCQHINQLAPSVQVIGEECNVLIYTDPSCSDNPTVATFGACFNERSVYSWSVECANGTSSGVWSQVPDYSGYSTVSSTAIPSKTLASISTITPTTPAHMTASATSSAVPTPTFVSQVPIASDGAHRDSGLSAAAEAGTIVGTIVGVAVVAFAMWMVIRHRRRIAGLGKIQQRLGHDTDGGDDSSARRDRDVTRKASHVSLHSVRSIGSVEGKEGVKAMEMV